MRTTFLWPTSAPVLAQSLKAGLCLEVAFDAERPRTSESIEFEAVRSSHDEQLGRIHFDTSLARPFLSHDLLYFEVRGGAILQICRGTARRR